MADETTLAPLVVLSAADPDLVTILLGEQADRKVSGWTEVEIVRTLESCPNSFRLGHTERSPSGGQVVVNAGEKVAIYLGGDVVLTGYADAPSGGFDERGHTLTIEGRGKCQDLVDCSAEWPGLTISNADVLTVAQKLAKPYGIGARLAEGAKLATAPQPVLQVAMTDTPWSVIEQMARYYQVLPFEDASGDLVLATLGTARHASGAAQGVNVLAAGVQRSQAEQFSEYLAYLDTHWSTGDIGEGPRAYAIAVDPNVKRHRRRVIQAEVDGSGRDLPAARALWEAAQRAGRSVQVTVTVDSWRDAAGKLWTPNTLVPLDLPNLPGGGISGVAWPIAEVTFSKGERGTSATLLVMPPQALSPEPVKLIPTAADLLGAS